MMRMSTKGHHATRILLYLAGAPERAVSKVEIGGAEGISPGYVQQVMSRLTSAGLVKSQRGKEGGFLLARPPEQISVRQVLDATEGPFELSPCVNPRSCCVKAQVCPAHALWQQASDYVNGLFGGTSLADLAASGQALQRQA